MKNKSYSPTKTVQKVFRILEALAEKSPAKPSELGKQLKLSRSNLYRLLSTVEDLGYVEKEADSSYSLSFKMFIVGSSVQESKNLIAIARTNMAHLAEFTQENVNLGVMYDNRVLYIDKIESKHYLKLDQPIGKTDPLYCTSLGKSLLSGLNNLEFEVFVQSTNFLPYTKNTVTSPEVLAGIIRNVKKQGYATDFEEVKEGIHCIGAPIYGYNNKVIAALSISGPSMRLTRQKIEEFKIPILQAVQKISIKMGCTEFSISS